MKYFYILILIPIFFPFITYLLPFIPNVIGGFQLTGISWIFVFIMAFYLLFNKISHRTSFPYIFWVPWIFYLFFYLIVDFSFNGLQLTLQYIQFVLIAIVFSKLRFSDFELVKMLRVSKWLLIFICVSSFIVKVIIGGWSLYTANYVMVLVVFGAVFLNIYFVTKKKIFILYYLILFLLPIMENTRMAMLVFMLLIPFCFTRIGFKRRLIFISLISVSALIVFYSEGFQEKTFYSGRGTISELLIKENPNLNDNGRGYFKEILQTGIKEKPVFGHGPRAAKNVLLLYQDKIIEVHNDYLAVRYNYGWVGLICLLIGLIGSLLHLYNMKDRILHQYDKILWSTSMVLVLAFLLFMTSDNILKYTFFYPNLLFCLIGIFYSRIKKKSKLFYVTK